MDTMAGRGERVRRQDRDGRGEKAGLPLCGTRRVTDAPVTCVTHASVESAVFAGTFCGAADRQSQSLPIAGRHRANRHNLRSKTKPVTERTNIYNTYVSSRVYSESCRAPSSPPAPMAAGQIALDRAYLVAIWLETLFYGPFSSESRTDRSLAHSRMQASMRASSGPTST